MAEYVKPFRLPQSANGNDLVFSGGSISDEIEKFGEPAHVLAPLSITHADQAALYQAGMLEEMDVDTKLLPEIKAAATEHYKMIHDARGRGNFNNDGIDYDSVVKPHLAFLPKCYEHVLWIPRPKWVLENGIHVPVEDKETAFTVALPPNGYGPVPTIDGLRHPKTGWVLATTPDKLEVIHKLTEYFVQIGVEEQKAQEFAKVNVSYSYRRQRDHGKTVVFRLYYLGDYNSFCEVAGWIGENRGRDLGTFHFSSSVESE